jgi:hypothetical protein
VKRSRLAAVDTSYLAARVLPDAPMAAGTKAATKPLAVELPLFSDLSLNLIGKQVEQMADGRVIWTGHVAGEPGHSAILVIDGTSVTGQVFNVPSTIEIRTVAGAVHVISEIDPNAFPTHHHVSPQPSAPSFTPSHDHDQDLSHGPSPIAPSMGKEGQVLALPKDPIAAAATSTTINVYVAYTTATAAASSNIVSEIQLAVAGANTAFTNSGVNIQYSLVGTGLVTYTEGAYTNSSDILTKFTTNSDGVMDTIHALRTAAGADLAALFVENLYDACGIAWLYTGKPTSGFSITQRSCASSGYTFAHETGHNMGANHDRYVESDAVSNIYAYGYVDTTNRFRDIMSYVDKCSAAGVSCSRIPYFSNPNVNYQGKPTGIDRSLPTSADVARRFNETAAGVARFRSGTSTSLPESGWWWSASEAGRGYSLEVSGNTIFFAFYTYASNGTPVWYVASAVMTDASTFYSQMQQYAGGQTLSSSYRAATLASNPGYVLIYFNSDRTATIYFWTSSTSWSSGSTINRFDFITNGAAIGPATGYPQTGWWWNASEAGRGFFIEAQNAAMFVSFYLYNSAGQATWYVASGTMVSSSLFSGTLSEYSGGSYFSSSTFRAPTGTTSQGTVTIQFGTSTTATLTMPSGSQVALTRFAF